MPYKVTFTSSRKPVLEWNDIEKQATIFELKEVCDEIYIKPEGRNMHSKKFAQNVIYTVRDCMMQKKHRKKLAVIVECNHQGLINDIIIRPVRGYKTVRALPELFGAILRADKEYSRIGGGILYRSPLYASPYFSTILEEKLRILLSD